MTPSDFQPLLALSLHQYMEQYRGCSQNLKSYAMATAMLYNGFLLMSFSGRNRRYAGGYVGLHLMSGYRF